MPVSPSVHSGSNIGRAIMDWESAPSVSKSFRDCSQYCSSNHHSRLWMTGRECVWPGIQSNMLFWRSFCSLNIPKWSLRLLCWLKVLPFCCPYWSCWWLFRLPWFSRLTSSKEEKESCSSWARFQQFTAMPLVVQMAWPNLLAICWSWGDMWLCPSCWDWQSVDKT